MQHPKHILDRYGLTPKKSLGQNFLFDDYVLARIAAAADLTPDDGVLEIGPGLGALTRHLAHIAGRVVAVEIDDRFMPILRQQLSDYPNVELILADILDFQPADYFQSSYKVAANVPYYITGAILRHLLAGPRKPTLMVMTVQQEVAERLAAEPGDLSLLAVSVQFYGRVEIVDKIKAGAFWPRPDVDSAVVRINLYDRRVVGPEEDKAFFPAGESGLQPEAKTVTKEFAKFGRG
jgi:16S rRNA (adenine1518-N6/adenine1519-N6)-dimethyltransferase